MQSSRYRINAPAAVSEVIDGEAVIMNLESGHYFSARALGGALWEAIVAGASVADLLKAVGETWPASAADHAIQQFVDGLLEHKLVATDSTRIASEAEPALGDTLRAMSAQPYLAPALDVFTDMQDLLLLDPIHDVGEAGWPMPASPEGGPVR